MIIKYSRKSRTKNVIEGYVRVPDTYATKHAIKLVKSCKGISGTNRTTFKRIFTQPTKNVREIDINRNQILQPNPWRTLNNY